LCNCYIGRNRLQFVGVIFVESNMLFKFQITSGAAKSTIKNFLLKRAFNAKLSLLRRGIVTKSTFWDKVVFG